MNHFGYACINMSLREKGIFNSHTMRKKKRLKNIYMTLVNECKYKYNVVIINKNKKGIKFVY